MEITVRNDNTHKRQLDGHYYTWNTDERPFLKERTNDNNSDINTTTKIEGKKKNKDA